MTTPQERAFDVLGDTQWPYLETTDELVVRVLSAALDEPEMVEAIRNAPCIRLGGMGCELPVYRSHPECAARAVLHLILGEKETK